MRRARIVFSIIVAVALATSGAEVVHKANLSGATATLLFADEFSGNKLNTKVWYRCFVWSNEDTGWGYGPPYDLEWYVKNNVAVFGGFLKLTAKKYSCGQRNFRS